MSRPITEVLSVERVMAAYEKTGLRPQAGRWFSLSDRCACAAGVVMVAEFGGPQIVCSSGVMFCLELEEDELAAFTNGFDVREVERASDRYRIAYEHGRAVARAVLGDSGGAP